jgi:hypothetical protein
MKTIIVDLDGTLADVRHRLSHVQTPGRKDWKAFFAGMDLDPLNVWCRELMVAMKNAGFGIAIVSGRPDEYEEVIVNWLKQYDIPYDALHLRRHGDRRPDNVVKRQILQNHFNKKEILFVVDDRASVVQMWRSEGLVCLQCNPHEKFEE